LSRAEVKMKLYNAIYVLLCVYVSQIFISPLVSAADSKQYYISSTSGQDHEIKLDYGISADRMRQQPDWSPLQATIPLQPQQAAQIGLKWFREKYPEVSKSSSVSMIMLEAIQLTEFKKWHYSIAIHLTDNAYKLLPRDGVQFVHVLLDGTIVEPQPKRESSTWFTTPFVPSK